MLEIVWLIGNRLALTSWLKEDQSLYLSNITFAILTTYPINNPSYFKLSNIFYKAMPPIKIKSTQVDSSNQYALGKRTWFPKEQKPKKQKLSHKLDEVIKEWFIKSKIHLGVQANTLEKWSEAKKLFYIW